MVRPKPQPVSELRQTPEHPDREMFSDLSPSHSPENLCSTVKKSVARAPEERQFSSANQAAQKAPGSKFPVSKYCPADIFSVFPNTSRLMYFLS